MTTKTVVENSQDAEEALSAVLAWAERAHPTLAILVRRCLLRLAAQPHGIH